MKLNMAKGTAAWPAEFSIASYFYEDTLPIAIAGNRELLVENTELVWDGNGPYSYLNSAQQLKVVSTSPNDTYGGSGTNVIYLEGLDANYRDLDETVVLSGTTPATTAGSFLRVFKATAVAGGENQGTISVKSNDQTKTLAVMVLGRGQTQSCLFTCPDNTTFYLSQMYGSCPHNGTKAAVSMWIRPYGMPWQCKGRIGFVGNPMSREVRIPYRVPAKADIEFRGEAFGATVAECSVGFAGWLEYGS